MTINISLNVFYGLIISLTLPSLIKTDSSSESSSIPPDQRSYFLPFVESIIDSRFKLLASNFQNQIDVLQTKVIRLENSKTSRNEKTKDQHPHGVQKRQTETSKPKRPVNIENIDSSCIFFYPDYPDTYRTHSKSSSNATNNFLNEKEIDNIQTQKNNRNNQKSRKSICENSSSFCTFFHPDHPKIGSKNDKNSQNNNSEKMQGPTNVNAISTQSQPIDCTTDHPESDAKTEDIKPTVTNEVSDDHTEVKGMPTSCMDLHLLGHTLNGVYLIKISPPNNQGIKIEAVFCDFNTSLAISQTVIGSVKITTRNTFFYVQRHSSFSRFNAVIPWELERINEGGAFNLASGVFTAPVPGIYHFEFHGFKDNCIAYLDIILQLNGATYAAATTGVTDRPGSLSLSATIRLKANDRVNMFNWKNSNPFPSGNLFDIAFLHVTHFSGWLLEEDLF